jgi:hypothetical protein
MGQFQHFGAVALSVCADLKSARKIGWSANARIANREISRTTLRILLNRFTAISAFESDRAAAGTGNRRATR